MKIRDPSHCNFVERVYTASYQDEHGVFEVLTRAAGVGRDEPERANWLRLVLAPRKNQSSHTNRGTRNRLMQRPGISCRATSTRAAKTAALVSRGTSLFVIETVLIEVLRLRPFNLFRSSNFARLPQGYQRALYRGSECLYSPHRRQFWGRAAGRLRPLGRQALFIFRSC